MRRLKAIIQSGWPEEKDQVPQDIRMYFTFRDELTVEDDMIFKGMRLVIPTSLRAEIKQKLHASHMGIESCLRRARECVFWPGLNAELKDFISSCEICQKHAISQQRETLIMHPQPSYPWERVGCDIFEYKDKNVLVTTDYYSTFWEVDQLKSLSSSQVILKLKAHFARHGIPQVLITDNGPQFSCERTR